MNYFFVKEELNKHISMFGVQSSLLGTITNVHIKKISLTNIAMKMIEIRLKCRNYLEFKIVFYL